MIIRGIEVDLIENYGRDGISTVYAHRNHARIETRSGVKIERRCDIFSCFSNHYHDGQEIEFVDELIFSNPGVYSKIVILWSDGN